ncbi:hypothetical protein SAMN02745218_01566 [Desulfofundulus australicus DSM 11792]|uniref:Thioredoxin domain-containing protein n=1 Tax=Desulfofundulus australicus DSM 11792 TaxID=1121425 RepID=A0A1M4ZAZ8_9FIRM|nr:hypothetical protein [Desulfofundulus australicus]SHF15220.1 hypothetical protein SAMN02745218_01566 [Desulfofundulus australicus DSM 11792]
MAEAVRSLPREILDGIELFIWNVKTLEGIMRKQELGARVIPALALNGEMVFESTIPPRDELIAAILKAKAKMQGGEARCICRKLS